LNQQPDFLPNSNHTSSSHLSNVPVSHPEDRSAMNLSHVDTVGSTEPHEEAIDWHRLLGVLKRRRKIIGFSIVGMLCLAGVYLALTPKIYQASADLLINTEQKSSGQSANALPAITDLLDATGTRSQDTEVEILRSTTVENAASSLVPPKMRPGIDKKIRVDIQPKRSTDIITVNVQSRYPDLAVAYVGGQLAVVRKNLDKKRDELRKFKEANGIVDLTAQSQASVTRLNDLQTALEQATTDRASSEAQLQNLRTQASAMAPAEIAPATIVVRPVVQQLKEQLTTLEAQRAATIQEFNDGTSEVKALDDQIASLRKRLQTEAKTEVGTYTRNINPTRQATLQSISQVLASIWALQAREKALRTNIARARLPVQRLPKNEYQLNQLQGDLATYQQTFQSLSDKYQTLLISQETPVANARVITPAVTALKVSPSVIRTLMLALLGGLLLASVTAMVVDNLDNKIYTEDDAVQATGLPVLTYVPLLALKSGQRPLIGDADSSKLAKLDSNTLLESFRLLRTQLSFIASYGHMKTLVLTSSQPGEGKSTVAANLAIALALNDKRVVLVDTDLRRPRVHKLFEVENIQGYTSVVANICTLEEALCDTDIKGLQVLPAGPTPPNPPELLDSRAARDIIEHLKSTFDYVIIDAPPALILADAQIVATMADGVLLVVSCQEATRGAVERTYQLMAQSGVKIPGMILNKFTNDQGSYGYYSYGHKEYAGYLDA
jgi:succinoglycan biosynthesis transport protein ExoP